MAISENSRIDDSERAIGIITKLFGAEVAKKTLSDVDAGSFFMEKAVEYLQCGVDTKTQSNRKPDIDLNRDLKYIATSIETQYHINIREQDMHFWRFVDLIEGLGDTLINQIREIRNVDLKEYKDDFKKRKAIIELKNHYALDNRKIEKPKSLKELYAEIERG